MEYPQFHQVKINGRHDFLITDIFTIILSDETLTRKELYQLSEYKDLEIGISKIQIKLLFKKLLETTG